jgi:hypothetical protein
MLVIHSICLAFVITEVLQFHRKVKWLNHKPFNCGLCLSGWVTLGLCLYQGENILLMPVAMVGYILLSKLIHI